jgi:hypothetical protein
MCPRQANQQRGASGDFRDGCTTHMVDQCERIRGRPIAAPGDVLIRSRKQQFVRIDSCSAFGIDINHFHRDTTLNGRLDKTADIHRTIEAQQREIGPQRIIKRLARLRPAGPPPTIRTSASSRLDNAAPPHLVDRKRAGWATRSRSPQPDLHVRTFCRDRTRSCANAGQG